MIKDLYPEQFSRLDQLFVILIWMLSGTGAVEAMRVNGRLFRVGVIYSAGDLIKEYGFFRLLPQIGQTVTQDTKASSPGTWPQNISGAPLQDHPSLLGKIPSTRPTRKTTGNSNPFAL